uniref:Laccase-1 (Fragments) n=1 Tax=Galerina sp. TaxID=671179 RepID=LAC1_GALSP|nr:RecName: Full=Laccase-1; Short=Lac1; AltName: Full=Benzenediol:oxygen oxidoreductase 1; AltName: Full=Diphenol oxidase 1; AltName: Full=Urishiol oxidase 1 [Galerina sp. DSM 22662]
GPSTDLVIGNKGFDGGIDSAILR